LGVYHLHRQGVIHRDIKLKNIHSDSHLVIADLGLAKVFMAPEIILGDSYGFAVGFWALRITLYEMLVGRVRDQIL
ncbi:kinase-like protein, partial [Rhizopogon salebrosus TDB-379]